VCTGVGSRKRQHERTIGLYDIRYVSDATVVVAAAAAVVVLRVGGLGRQGVLRAAQRRFMQVPAHEAPPRPHTATRRADQFQLSTAVIDAQRAANDDALQRRQLRRPVISFCMAGNDADDRALMKIFTHRHW